MRKPPKLADVDLSAQYKDHATYAKDLKHEQLRFLKLQTRTIEKGERALIAFEGWDASGKGGAIKRITAPLDPRKYKVWPIAAPTQEEQGKHYLYRFWRKLPARGTWAFFDRSWYGRVLVERVEKLATKPEWKRAYREINEFERMLVDDGAPVVKLFFHVSQKTQLRRFEEREASPWTRWKMTKDDWRNRKKWDAYVDAIDEMLDKTSTPHAPWIVVPGDHKWYARVHAARAIAKALG